MGKQNSSQSKDNNDENMNESTKQVEFTPNAQYFSQSSQLNKAQDLDLTLQKLINTD